MTLKVGAVPGNVGGDCITRFAPKFLQGCRFWKWQNKGAGLCSDQVIRRDSPSVRIFHEVFTVHKLPNQIRGTEIQNPTFRIFFLDGVGYASAENWSDVLLPGDLFTWPRQRNEHRSASVLLDKISG